MVEPDAPYRSALRWLFSDLVARAAAGVVPAGAAERAAALGYTLTEQEDRVLLAPSGADPRAIGICAVRLGGGVAPVVLEAPHTWSDLHTGELAARLFDEGLGRVACFGTARRQDTADGGGIDLAHSPSSAFQAATIGTVEALPDPLVVQLHGFGAGHGSFAAVLSAGSALQPARLVERAVARLDPLFSPLGPVVDAAFVPALAGERNVQGWACGGRARFLHLELSLPVRQHLRDDGELRAGLRAALAALAEAPR